MKYLRVTMPDGSKWDVPAELIAKSRASYYAKLDSERGEGNYDEIYAREMQYTMNDASEMKDWAANNMNWSDIKAFAVCHQQSLETDFDDGWCNGEKEVVEKP